MPGAPSARAIRTRTGVFLPAGTHARSRPDRLYPRTPVRHGKEALLPNINGFSPRGPETAPRAGFGG